MERCHNLLGWVRCLFSDIPFEWQGDLYFDLTLLAIWQKIWKFCSNTKIWKFPAKTKIWKFPAKTKIPELSEAAVTLTQLLVLWVNSLSGTIQFDTTDHLGQSSIINDFIMGGPNQSQ